MTSPVGRNDQGPPVASNAWTPDREAFWPIALSVFILALSVRLLHLVQVRQAPFFSLLLGDAGGYDAWAQRIAAGDWVGQEVFYQAPLYPYFLGVIYSVFGRDLMGVRIVQAGLGAVAAVLTAIAARNLFGRRAGLMSGLALALYAPAVFFDGLVQKASLDLFLTAALLALVTRVAGAQGRTRPALFAMGVVLGCFILSRENALTLVPLLLGWLLVVEPRRGSAAVSFAFGLAIVLLPVVGRNYAVGGELHLTTSQSGTNLYIGNHDGATGTYQPLRRGRGSVSFEQADARAIAEAAEGRPLGPGEVSTYWSERAVGWIREHPGDWLRLVARKAILVCNAAEGTDTEDLDSHADWSPVLRVLSFGFHFGVLMPLAAFGIWITRTRWRDLLILYLAIVVYALSVVAFYVVARYRFPLVPLLMPFVGVALTTFPRWWSETGLRGKAEAFALVLAAGVIANWPIQSRIAMKSLTRYNTADALRLAGRSPEAIEQLRGALELDPDNSAARSNLGALLAERGEHDAALALYREAIERDPGSAAAHNNFGQEMAMRGQFPEAVASFRRSILLDPLDGSPHYSLGLALASEGETGEAVSEFKEAIRLDSGNAPAHNNLGILLASSGRLEEGIAHFKAALQLKPDFPEASMNLDRAEGALKATPPATPRR